jgi:hypothetical protein
MLVGDHQLVCAQAGKSQIRCLHWIDRLPAPDTLQQSHDAWYRVPGKLLQPLVWRNLVAGGRRDAELEF